MTLVLEQLLNGVQLGVMLFLLASGLALIFGIMGVINLAHGSLYMIGAFASAITVGKTGSFLLSVPVALAVAGVAGLVMEFLFIRRLYARSHLDQVLATFALILTCNQGITMLFGRQPLFVEIPAILNGSVTLMPGLSYPIYRLMIIIVGVLVALGL